MVLMQLFKLRTLNKFKIVQDQSRSKYWCRLAKVLIFVQWYDSLLLLNYAHNMTEIIYSGSGIDMNILTMPHQLFH
jgi:hypothetical protein